MSKFLVQAFGMRYFRVLNLEDVRRILPKFGATSILYSDERLNAIQVFEKIGGIFK